LFSEKPGLFSSSEFFFDSILDVSLLKRFCFYRIPGVFFVPESPGTEIHGVFFVPESPGTEIHGVFFVPESPGTEIHGVFFVLKSPGTKIHCVFNENEVFFIKSQPSVVFLRVDYRRVRENVPLKCFLITGYRIVIS
jgi:hypothetical protein